MAELDAPAAAEPGVQARVQRFGGWAGQVGQAGLVVVAASRRGGRVDGTVGG